MGKVVDFTGPTVGNLEPDDVLKAATGVGMDQVLILGWKGDDFYMATSEPDTRDTLMLLQIANHALLSRFVE